MDPHRSEWVDVLGDGQALPFADRSFDTVVSSHTVEHFPDPVLGLRECVRVLKFRGFMTHIIPDASFAPRRTLSARYPFAGHYNEWTPKDFAEVVARVDGINVVSLREFKGTRWSFEFIALRIQD